MTQNLPAAPRKDAIAELLNAPHVKARFDQVLGKKAAGFMSSVISAVNSNSALKGADQMSVVASAAVAASLDLPINPSLGFAHIVPYKKDGVMIAQFQMGWRGYVQLAMRSGQYKTMNVSTVYEGELIDSNRFTGEMAFDEKRRSGDKIIGYVAYFKLINGFEKYLYMTVDQVKAHGKKYSQSFDNAKGKWKLDFDAMAMKTVIKMLLSKFGILSIEMQTAVQIDQAAFRNLGADAEYIDGTSQPALEGDFSSETSNGEEGGEPEKELTDLEKFTAAIPEGTDMTQLDSFLAKTAVSNKTTPDAVKAEAVKDKKSLAGFWKFYTAWAKQQKAQADAARQDEAMAPAACPDHPETIYKVSFCDKCAKRQGCPVFEV